MKLFNVMFKKVVSFFKPQAQPQQSAAQFVAQASSMGLVPVPVKAVHYPAAKYARAYRKRYGG